MKLLCSILFLFSFCMLSTVVHAQQGGPAITRAGAVIGSRVVSSSTAWINLAASFERGIDVNNPTGSGDICLARNTNECSTVTNVTACPLQIVADASFEFLAEQDRYNGRICVRLISGSTPITLGTSRW